MSLSTPAALAVATKVQHVMDSLALQMQQDEEAVASVLLEMECARVQACTRLADWEAVGSELQRLVLECQEESAALRAELHKLRSTGIQSQPHLDEVKELREAVARCQNKLKVAEEELVHLRHWYGADWTRRDQEFWAQAEELREGQVSSARERQEVEQEKAILHQQQAALRQRLLQVEEVVALNKERRREAELRCEEAEKARQKADEFARSARLESAALKQEALKARRECSERGKERQLAVKERDQMRAALLDAELELQRVSTELENLKKQTPETPAERTPDALATLQAKLAELAAEHALRESHLRSSLEASQQSVQRLQEELLESQNKEDEVQSQGKSLEGKRIELQERLDREKAEQTIQKELMTRLSILEHEKEELVAELEGLKAHDADSAGSLQGQRAELSEGVKRLELLKADLESQLKQVATEHVELQGQVKSLRCEKAVLLGQVENLEGEKAALDEQLKVLRTQHSVVSEPKQPAQVNEEPARPSPEGCKTPSSSFESDREAAQETEVDCETPEGRWLARGPSLGQSMSQSSHLEQEVQSRLLVLLSRRGASESPLEEATSQELEEWCLVDGVGSADVAPPADLVPPDNVALLADVALSANMAPLDDEDLAPLADLGPNADVAPPADVASSADVPDSTGTAPPADVAPADLAPFMSLSHPADLAPPNNMAPLADVAPPANKAPFDDEAPSADLAPLADLDPSADETPSADLARPADVPGSTGTAPPANVADLAPFISSSHPADVAHYADVASSADLRDPQSSNTPLFAWPASLDDENWLNSLSLTPQMLPLPSADLSPKPVRDMTKSCPVVPADVAERLRLLIGRENPTPPSTSLEEQYSLEQEADPSNDPGLSIDGPSKGDVPSISGPEEEAPSAELARKLLLSQQELEQVRSELRELRAASWRKDLASVGELEGLRDELGLVIEQLEEKEQENARLQAEVGQLKSELDKWQAGAVGTEAELQSKAIEIRDLKQTLKDKQEEIDGLVGQLKSLQESAVEKGGELLSKDKQLKTLKSFPLLSQHSSVLPGGIQEKAHPEPTTPVQTGPQVWLKNAAFTPGSPASENSPDQRLLDLLQEKEALEAHRSVLMHDVRFLVLEREDLSLELSNLQEDSEGLRKLLADMAAERDGLRSELADLASKRQSEVRELQELLLELLVAPKLGHEAIDSDIKAPGCGTPEAVRALRGGLARDLKRAVRVHLQAREDAEALRVRLDEVEEERAVMEGELLRLSQQVRGSVSLKKGQVSHPEVLSEALEGITSEAPTGLRGDLEFLERQALRDDQGKVVPNDEVSPLTDQQVNSLANGKDRAPSWQPFRQFATEDQENLPEHLQGNAARLRGRAKSVQGDWQILRRADSDTRSENVCDLMGSTCEGSTALQRLQRVLYMRERELRHTKATVERLERRVEELEERG